MAALALPASLKPLTRFVQHAAQFDKIDNTVAYHCRLFLVEQIMAFPNKGKDEKAYLTNLLDIVERDENKALIGKMGRDQCQLICENKASDIFNTADQMDRNNVPEYKNTAKAFYAASVLIEICAQFGSLSSDLEEKLKYAQWKAADITKAIRENRVPTSGPAGGEPSDMFTSMPSVSTNPPLNIQSQSQPQANYQPPLQPTINHSNVSNPHSTPGDQQLSNNNNNVSSNLQHTSAQLQQQIANAPIQPIQQQPSRVEVRRNDPMDVNRMSLLETKVNQIDKSEKLIRHALGSLHFQDVDTSISKLREALALLIPYQSAK